MLSTRPQPTQPWPRCILRILPALAACALCVVAQLPSAHAAPRAGERPDQALAERLDGEGDELFNQKHYGEAVAKFAASYRAYPGTGVLLRLGLSQELAGQKASALETFREALALARASGNTAVAQLASRRVSLLEPVVPRIVLRLRGDGPPPGFVVTCDGVKVGETSLSLPHAVDVGPHRIDASAPGHRSFAAKVNVAAEGATYEVLIELPANQGAGEGGELASPSSVAFARDPAASPPQTTHLGPRRTAALAVGGAGLAAMVVGSVFGVSAVSKLHNARAACDESAAACEASGVALRDQARSAATVSTVSFGLGAAAIVGGVAVWIASPSARKQTVGQRAFLTPTWTSQGGGVNVGWIW